MPAAADQDDDYYHFRGHKVRKPIAVAYVLSTLYNVTFFVQFMAMPYITKEIGISDEQFGYLGTFFGILQIVGGPVFGHITQKYGIRPALFLCYSSTLLSAVLLYFSQDLTMMYITRLPVFFMHGQQGHQTLLSLLTEPGVERTSAFGRMGLTFGISFMFTPVIQMGSKYIFGSRGALITITILGLLPFIVFEAGLNRRDYDHTVHEDSAKSSKPPAAVTWSSAVRVLKKPGTVNILLKKNAPIAPMLFIFSILQIFMLNAFAASQETNSMIQMMTGICIMLSNGFGVIWLRKHFDEQKLLLFGTLSFIIAFALYLYFVRLWMIAIIMPFTSFGMSLVATVGDSLLTSLVEEKEQGVILGVATAVNSFVRTFAPALAGALLARYGLPVFGIIGIIFSSLGVLACWLYPVDSKLLREHAHAKDE